MGRARNDFVRGNVPSAREIGETHDRTDDHGFLRKAFDFGLLPIEPCRQCRHLPIESHEQTFADAILDPREDEAVRHEAC